MKSNLQNRCWINSLKDLILRSLVGPFNSWSRAEITKLLSVFAVFMVLASIATNAWPAMVQWKKADGGNDHWYEVVVTNSGIWSNTTGINFSGAMTASTAKGGYLATPDLTGEASFIYNSLVAPSANSKYQIYWLGAYSTSGVIGSPWEWVTGGTVTSWGGYTYIDWALNYGERQGICQVPNNYWYQPGYALQDAPQSYLVNGFVVEYSTAPSFFDPASDFSATNNPSGAWSYGWSPSLGSTFNLYPNTFSISNLDFWNKPNYGTEPPIVFHNGTQNAQPLRNTNVVLQPGQLALHPGGRENSASSAGLHRQQAIIC